MYKENHCLSVPLHKCPKWRAVFNACQSMHQSRKDSPGSGLSLHMLTHQQSCLGPALLGFHAHFSQIPPSWDILRTQPGSAYPGPSAIALAHGNYKQHASSMQAAPSMRVHRVTNRPGLMKGSMGSQRVGRDRGTEEQTPQEWTAPSPGNKETVSKMFLMGLGFPSGGFFAIRLRHTTHGPQVSFWNLKLLILRPETNKDELVTLALVQVTPSTVSLDFQNSSSIGPRNLRLPAILTP